jgi:uncharacterized membrane protein
MLSLQKIGYWLWPLPVALVPLSYYLAQNSSHANAWAFLAPILIFGLMPTLDTLLGRVIWPTPKKAASARHAE